MKENYECIFFLIFCNFFRCVEEVLEFRWPSSLFEQTTSEWIATIMAIGSEEYYKGAVWRILSVHCQYIYETTLYTPLQSKWLRPTLIWWIASRFGVNFSSISDCFFVSNLALNEADASRSPKIGWFSKNMLQILINQIEQTIKKRRIQCNTSSVQLYQVFHRNIILSMFFFNSPLNRPMYHWVFVPYSISRRPNRI